MQFSVLSQYFEKIENNSSRLVITEILSDLFKKLSPEEIEKTVYLLQGRVVPAFEKIEFGMAEKTIQKTIIMVLNVERSYFIQEYKKLGDLGKTAEQFKKQYLSIEQKDLSIMDVFGQLYVLATSSGDGAMERKTAILGTLISQLDALSVRYLVRIPQNMMRLGFSDMTILDAYSWMIKSDKSLRKELEHAYLVQPDLGKLGRFIKEHGVSKLSLIKPEVGTPIIMMRAERLSSGEEIIKQIGACAVEPKYDGFRLQVHFKHVKSQKLKLPGSDFIKIFSRSLEEVSYMFPDLVEGMRKEICANECIIEGEAIGYNPQTNEFLPFQETVQRKRKYNITEKAQEVPLKLFTFEILYKDGVSYIDKPFSTRRHILEQTISKNTKKSIIITAPHTLMDKGIDIEKKFDTEIEKGLEGIIAKKLDGIYQPGARAWNWIKFKRSYSSKIQDTIDCLIMGYDFGKGKRTGFGIGAFLVGVYDEKKDQYVTIAKIGTGLTDEEWREIQVKSEKLKINKKPNNYRVDKAMECDVWIQPQIVVEIRADEITKSPIHSAGLALRFPRLERFRNDKSSSDTTTIGEIQKMYKG